MKEFDLYLPLTDNNRQPFSARMFRSVQNELLSQFGGVTYHDEIVIFRVITPHTVKARKFFRSFKKKLLKAFNQLDLLIVERDVETL